VQHPWRDESASVISRLIVAEITAPIDDASSEQGVAMLRHRRASIVLGEVAPAEMGAVCLLAPASIGCRPLAIPCHAKPLCVRSKGIVPTDQPVSVIFSLQKYEVVTAITVRWSNCPRDYCPHLRARCPRRRRACCRRPWKLHHACVPCGDGAGYSQH